VAEPNSAEQPLQVRAYPDRFGSMVGLPTTARGEVNLLVLACELATTRRTLAALRARQGHECVCASSSGP
jgi:hypothetical protein